ncbi:MAG: phage late control D family protein [Verrucomicrobiales bacterium]|nr:phage late control D family protein [Verrucomicrobiales bacterium]
MTEPLLASVAPVIEIDGEVSGDLARDLVRLEVDETTAGLKTLTLRLLAQGPLPGEVREGLRYLDGALLDFGRALTVSIGPADTARRIFDGNISALEVTHEEGRPPEVTLFAEDKLMALRMTRRCKTYESMTDAQIAESIAAEHGLTPAVDADGPTYDRVQQWNMSDLAFLRERGRLIQAELWVLDDTLHFQQRDRRSATRLTLVQGNHLIEARLRADLAHQRTRIKVSGYDAGKRERIEEEADVSALSGDESGGGVTGPAVLERAFGARVSYRVRNVPLAAAEAASWAEAEMRRRARAFVTATGTTRGSADLVVGSQLTLENVGHPFEGPAYLATHVTHTYDATEGFRTRFLAERAVLQEGS